MFQRVLVALILSAGAGWPAALTVDGKDAKPGETVTVAVRLASDGVALTGFQADVNFDGRAMEVTGAAGERAAQSGKQFAGRLLELGRYRMLLIGLNRNRIADGEVVVLTVKVGAAAGGEYTLRLSRLTGTDGDGNPVTLNATAGKLTVRP